MRTLSAQQSKLLAALLGTALLSACGAGSSVPPAALSAPAMAAAEAAPIDPPADAAVTTVQSGSAAEVPLTGDMVAAPPPPPTFLSSTTSVLTNVRFESTASQTTSDPTSPTSTSTGTASSEQLRVPVTFGQPFAVGHVKSTHTITAKMADGSVVPLQVDVKARHPDGSVRHAILSVLLAKLGAGQTQSMTLSATKAGTTAATDVLATPATLLDGGFSASVNATIGGLRYSAAADKLLRSGNYKTWLAGPLVNEWHVSAPLTTAAGTAHPHLSARFAIRAVTGSKQARVDVTLENNWAYEAAPQNFVYDAQVLVGGLPVYSKAALNHYHHARWRKVFWSGEEPKVNVKHNVAYLIGTRALPNFDQSIIFPETKLASWKAGWTGAKIEPMGAGQATPYMPSTGGRDDIGLLPAWAATYLLSQDRRAKDVTLGSADLAGSWSSHYRDRNTDKPVSLVDYPYMTILGRSTDTVNPATKQQEAFPVCAAADACNSPNYHDASHQPAFAYLPYLVTGDYYYLEELQFWATWNSFVNNPGYRDYVKALVHPDQVRGQAWAMRTLAEAAYISPDNDRLKGHFTTYVNNNLDWFTTNYLVAGGPLSNNLGVITNGYAVVYEGGIGLAPWQDDFFTAAIGHVAELGFTKAGPLLAWKAKFPISRMVGAGSCWIDGAMYSMRVRDTATSPLYATIGQAFAASTPATLASTACGSSAMATALNLQIGEMTGYSSYVAGYPSNMQPALAYAADAGGLAGANAWGVFIGRSVKPDYSQGPQFAIVPRK